MVLEYHNIFFIESSEVFTLIGLYLHVDLASIGLKVIYIGVLSPKNYYFFREMRTLFFQIKACKLKILSLLTLVMLPGRTTVPLKFGMT